MKRVRIIQGRPIYVFKGSQYIDKPARTIVKRMKYSEEEGVTYIYCKRVSHLFEIICVCLLVGIACFNRLELHSSQMNVRYNSLVNYYNGNLYLNIKADERNPYKLEYSIDGHNGVLSPGQSLISMEIEKPLESYTITFKYKTLIRTVSFDVTVFVVNRDYGYTHD